MHEPIINLMLKSQKIHPVLVFGLYVFVYCALLIAVLLVGLNTTETNLNFDLVNANINAITYIY